MEYFRCSAWDTTLRVEAKLWPLRVAIEVHLDVHRGAKRLRAAGLSAAVHVVQEEHCGSFASGRDQRTQSLHYCSGVVLVLTDQTSESSEGVEDHEFVAPLERSLGRRHDELSPGKAKSPAVPAGELASQLEEAELLGPGSHHALVFFAYEQRRRLRCRATEKRRSLLDRFHETSNEQALAGEVATSDHRDLPAGEIAVPEPVGFGRQRC